jgi:hydrogenase 3 maturation protease
MVVIVGVGNLLRKDDAIGLKVVEELKKEVKRKFKFFLGYETPENFIRKIEKLKPRKVFIVDAIDFGGKIGEVKRIKIEEAPFFTHKPTHQIFKSILSCEVEIIGIQPNDLGWGERLSKKMASKFEQIKEKVKEIILEEV